MDLLTATRLQELRKMNGYSQEALAEKLGVSRQAISKWERAEASPEIDNLMALSKIYGMSVDELLNTDDDKVIVQSPEKDEKDLKTKTKTLLSKANDFGLMPNAAKKLMLFPFPLAIVILYLALSMAFDIWHPLWIIFLTIPIYYRTAAACKANNSKAFAMMLPVPEFIVTMYLTIGAATDIWGYPCVLFMAIPVYYWAVIFTKKRGKGDE